MLLLACPSRSCSFPVDIHRLFLIWLALSSFSWVACPLLALFQDQILLGHFIGICSVWSWVRFWFFLLSVRLHGQVISVLNPTFPFLLQSSNYHWRLMIFSSRYANLLLFSSSLTVSLSSLKMAFFPLVVLEMFNSNKSLFGTSGTLFFLLQCGIFVSRRAVSVPFTRGILLYMLSLLLATFSTLIVSDYVFIEFWTSWLSFLSILFYSSYVSSKLRRFFLSVASSASLFLLSAILQPNTFVWYSSIFFFFLIILYYVIYSE